MKIIFYIGWFIFIVITSPFAFLKIKWEQYFCNHKDLMYKGKNAICVHFGKVILILCFLLSVSIGSFCQSVITANNDSPATIFKNLTLSSIKGIIPTHSDTVFFDRISKDAIIRQKDSSELYIFHDSVFVAHYFYVSDSTHPYRIGGGYIGKKSDFNIIMKGKDKLKFRNR